MNCSGKHAAMLATCVVNGWDTDDLPRRPTTRCSRRSRETFAELTGEPVDRGRGRRLRRARCCPTSLIGLARAFRRAGAWRPTGPERAGGRRDPRAPGVRVRHPRDERALLAAIPGAIGKAGAESCYAVALADGRAFALKTDDGAPRVRPVLMAAALRRSGVDIEAGRRRRGGTPHRPSLRCCSAAAARWGRSAPAVLMLQQARLPSFL